MLLAVLLALQLAPALPTVERVFDEVAAADVPATCKSEKLCEISQREAIRKLRSAYSADATSADQRMKMLELIDANRKSDRLDYATVVTDYFAWRQRETEAGKVWVSKDRPTPPMTSTTTCSSHFGRYSSSTTCTSY